MFVTDKDVVVGEEVGCRHALTEMQVAGPESGDRQIKETEAFLSLGMQPVPHSINKEMRENWDYNESIKTVRHLFHSYRTVSEELLWELWWAKYNLTDGFTRTAGRAKAGERTWNTYITACFMDNGGPSKRAVDTWIDAFIAAGYTKPVRLNPPKVEPKAEGLDTSLVAQAVTIEDTPSMDTTLDQDRYMADASPELVSTFDSESPMPAKEAAIQQSGAVVAPKPVEDMPVLTPVEPQVEITGVEKIGDKVWFTIVLPHTGATYRQVIPA